MIPFPTPMMAKPAEVGGGGVPNWRFLFPAGGITSDTNVAISEAQMFASDVSSTDLCVGGTASASSTFLTNVASRGFDDDVATVWYSAAGAAVGSWLQYAHSLAVDVTSFSLASYFSNSEYAPQTVKLQKFTGGAWVDVLDFTAFDLPWPLVVGNSNNVLRFYSDGLIDGYYLSATTTTGSGSAFATKGQILTANYDTDISSLEFYIAPAGTETYKATLVEVDTSNVITSIVAASSPASHSTTGTKSFSLGGTYTIAAGQRFAVLLTRTDAGTTGVNRVAAVGATAGASNSAFTNVGVSRYATTTPAVSDSILLNTTDAFRTGFNYTISP